ncbi:hypothetical protein Naga_100017g7 [Nannochloropsis gaditana]|uniref:Uncharacterized protein n=1 Tax=Nannochloropsis gaditana TaxID=72520 RepID=W7TUM4_9STRA|nr:hypothetical protein Naga_100017g7 [Nannochloropsis gaditana]
MAQGLAKLSKKGFSQKSKKAHAKASSKRTAAKKGNPTQLPKNIQRRGMALEQARITKAINQNVERVSSARALKAGDTFSMQDVKRIGKEMNRDMRREELSRKKSRVEEKLAELQAKVEEAS